MDITVGTDIVEISRISKLIGNPRFLNRVLSELEREYVIKKGKGMSETAAGIFAAKEAFGKAVGTGIFVSTLRDIEILHDERGKPYIKLGGDYSQAYKDIKFSVSVSHCEHYAVATVIAFKA